MAIENFGEVSEYLKTNAEVPEIKTYLDGLKVAPTLEAFKGKLNDPDFKSFMDSSNDVHSSKSLKTWQDNNLDKIYQERFLKENPAVDANIIALNKLQAEFEAMKNESTHKDLTNFALKKAQEKKLPVELVDFFVGLDEPTTVKNIESLEKIFSAHIEAIVAEKLKGSTYVPPAGGGSGAGTTFSKDQISKMSTEEINANWDAINKVLVNK